MPVIQPMVAAFIRFQKIALLFGLIVGPNTCGRLKTREMRVYRALCSTM